MVRRRYYLLIGLVFCWLAAGLYGGTLTAYAEATAAPEAKPELSTPGTPGTSGSPASSPAGLGAKSSAQQLERSAEALYGYVVDGNVAKVRQESEEISRIFVSASFEGLTSVQGINALSAVIPELKAALARRGGSTILIAVGGVIPTRDFATLRAAGADAIFPPGTVISEAALALVERMLR